jgi:hypothetical protein
VSSKKRAPAVLTPTGLTPKSKRVLFSSPTPKKKTPQKCKTVNKSTQTPVETGDYTVKVIILDILNIYLYGENKKNNSVFP